MKTLAISLILVMTAFMGISSATMIPDTYLHPLDRNTFNPDQRGVDRIGNNPPFEIYGYEWLSNGTELNIYTSWSHGLDGNNIYDSKLGDVFLYTPKGTFAVALRTHDASENDGIQQGWIFTPTNTRTSDYYYDPLSGTKANLAYWQYGDNEVVTASGDQVDSVISLTMTPYDPNLNQSIIVIDFNENMQGGIRFGQICGNDVIATPEPATMLLLGSGLIGLASFLGRNKFFKK